MSNKKSSSKKKTWKIVSAVLLVLQLILSIVAVVELVASKMVPTAYLILFVILMWALFFVAFALLVLVRKKKGQKKSSFYAKRGLGTALSALTMICCILATYYVGKLDSTLGNLTIGGERIETETVSVYVKADSPASQIGDVANGKFGVMLGYGYEASNKTVEAIEKEVGKDIEVEEFASVYDTVDALLSGEIDAMIMHLNYEEMIVDQEGYEFFITDTKVIYQNFIETVVKSEQSKVDKDVSNDVFMVYVSGSDTRSVKLSKSRSDVNIIAVVNPDAKQVLLVNTPRDYYVPISISSTGTCDKLTHCSLYGHECSMDTLGALYNCSMDYYMQINFEGFMTLIDAIGGITVESDKTFVTTHYDKQIYEGLNDMDGETALGFARERYAFVDGDNTRGRNSMRIIKAIIEKMSSAKTLLSNYGAILNSIEGMFATSMTEDEMKALVNMQLDDMSSWDVRMYAVTGTGDSRTTYSVPNAKAYVMIPDQSSVDKAIRLIDKMEAGEVLTDADFQ